MILKLTQFIHAIDIKSNNLIKISNQHSRDQKINLSKPIKLKKVILEAINQLLYKNLI